MMDTTSDMLKWIAIILVFLMFKSHTHKDISVPVSVPVTPKVWGLPEKCAEFYDDGTEDWINCMGVGYVREEDNEMD